MGGDAGRGGGVDGVDGDGVGGAVGVGVVGDHLGEVEGFSAGGGYWGADQAAEDLWSLVPVIKVVMIGDEVEYLV